MLAQEDLQEEGERRKQQSKREIKKEGWKMERRDKAGWRQEMGREKGRWGEGFHVNHLNKVTESCRPAWPQILFSPVSTPSRESRPTHGAPAGSLGKWQSPEAEPAMGRAGAAVSGAIVRDHWGPLWEPGTQEGGDNRQSLGQGPQQCLKQDAQCSLGHTLG